MQGTIDGVCVAEAFAFVAVIRAGSFTAAGKRLAVPKSTLSRQVARLEERLGARLLQRTTRRLSLTETGYAYYERCVRAVEEIEAATRIAADDAGVPRGTLRASVPIDLARDWFAGLLPRFRARYPEISLSLDVNNRRVDLVAEGFDVALRAGAPLDPGLVARRLMGSPPVFVASPAYLERRGEPKTLADLAHHDVIAFGPMPFERWPIEGPAGLEPTAFRAWLTANEWGVLRLALRAGLGVGLLLEDTARDDVKAGLLRRVLPGYHAPGTGLYAVYPSRHHLSPKVRVFVDFLLEQLRCGNRLTLRVARNRHRGRTCHSRFVFFFERKWMCSV